MRAMNGITSWVAGLWLLLLPVFAAPAWAELPDFRQLIKQNQPAVVNISTTQKATEGQKFQLPGMPDLPEDSPLRDFFKRFFEQMPNQPPERQAQSLGSGFIISADGYLLTNAHVVKGADKIIVRTPDRREQQAKLIGVDERTDLALIKVEDRNLPTVKIGNSDHLEVGEWVFAIGSPFGLEYTATQGIVSALGRSLPSETYVPFIQTDVAVNPGNSGGPLFNLQGEVIGVNSQIYSQTGGFMGLSFAIPINLAMRVADELKTSGRVSRGWLGVMIQSVNQELAESFGLERPRGALVAQVLPDSPASKAGIKVGDIILNFNGQDIEEWSRLPALVGVTPVGKEVPVMVLRDDKTLTVKTTVEELKEEQQATAGDGGKGATRQSGRMDSRLQLRVIDLSAEERQEMNLPERGVLVKDVEAGPAAEAGLQAGDVILTLNRQEVNNVEQFMARAKELPAGKTVPLLVQRDGKALFMPLRVPGKR